MQTWQKMVIQTLVGLVLYLIGIRGVREILRKIIRKKWGDIVLQLLVFVLLVLAYLFLMVPPLDNYTLIGAIFVALTVTSLSSLMQEYATLGSDVKEWFGEGAKEMLKYLPSDCTINQRGLRRLASILVSRGHVRTVKKQDNIEFHKCLDEGFWVYDGIQRSVYELQDDTEVSLVWEVWPGPLPLIPHDWNHPPFPLSYRRPSDKWHFSYWLPISVNSLDFWEQWMEQITAEGHLRPHERGERLKIDFRREIEQSTLIVGSREIAVKYPRFTANIVLNSGNPALSIHVKGLLQPIEISSMLFYVWDLCTESWEFHVSTDPLGDSLTVSSMFCLTNLGDVAIPWLQIRHGFAQLRMESLKDSAIVPQDGVLVRLSSSGCTQEN